MKLVICSDLHLEQYVHEFKSADIVKSITKRITSYKADVLCLIGDIGSFVTPVPLITFLEIVSKHFLLVFYVPGNHEFYGQTLTVPKRFIEKLPDNVIMLNNDSYKLTINGYTHKFIGSPLWSRIHKGNEKNVTNKVGTFTQIKNMDVYDFNKLHDKCLLFIREELKKDDADNMIILTHYAPFRQENKFPDQTINDAFTTDALQIMKDWDMLDKVSVWGFGHTHVRNDQHIDGIYVCSAPLGSPGELGAINEFEPQGVIINNSTD